MDEAKKTKKNEKKKQKQAMEKGGHKKPWREVELVLSTSVSPWVSKAESSCPWRVPCSQRVITRYR